MKKYKAILFSMTMILLLAECKINMVRSNEDDRRVVWNNCFSCHAPSDYLNGLPQDEMLKKYGEKELKKYLLDEFVRDKDLPCEDNYHCDIILTRSEVKSIMKFLIDMD